MTTKQIESIISPVRLRLQNRIWLRTDGADDEDDGQWITTKNGHKVHLNEEGNPDKGNPHVIEKMDSPKKKQKVYKPKLSKKKLKQLQEKYGHLPKEIADKFINARDPSEPVNAYVDNKERIWEIYKTFDDVTKLAFEKYTGMKHNIYQKMNGILRTDDPSTVKDHFPFYDEWIDKITDAIDKSELPVDTMLYRGMGTYGAAKLFGVPEEVLKNNPESLVGRTGVDNAFGSCMSAKDTKSYYYTEKPVQLEILAPEGTKALYVEPFSSLGFNQGGDWVRGGNNWYFPKVSWENETMMQRGTGYQIIDYREEDGKIIYSAMVISQDYEGSAYNNYKKGKG